MDELFSGTGNMFIVVVIIMFMVFFAIAIDLGAGLYKAKYIRKEDIESDKLKRTVSKFISYQGGLMISAMADTLIHFSKFYELIRFDILTSVPVVTILIGLFLLVVEFKSVREKADEKTRKEQNEVAMAIAQIISKKDDLIGILEYLKNRQNKQEEDG